MSLSLARELLIHNAAFHSKIDEFNTSMVLVIQIDNMYLLQ